MRTSPISAAPTSEDSQAVAISIHELLDKAERLIAGGHSDLGIESYMLACDRMNDAEDALSFLAVVQHAERVMRECVLPEMERINPAVFQ